LSGATGVGRHRVDWDILQASTGAADEIGGSEEDRRLLPQAEEYEEKIAQLHSDALKGLSPLELEGEIAVDRLASTPRR